MRISSLENKVEEIGSSLKENVKYEKFQAENPRWKTKPMNNRDRRNPANIFN